VAKAFAAFVEAMPTASGFKNSRWTMLFAALERMADGRARRPLQARLTAGNDGRYLVEHHILPLARRALQALPEVEPTAAERAELVDLMVRVAALTRQPPPPAEALLAELPPRRRASGEDELLAVIYATPEDDGPRFVYSDWLQERGDPRAELLLLQLKGGQRLKEVRRARRLVREHARAWLGPLEPAIAPGTEVFARGFLAEGQVVFTTAAQRARLLGHPAWNTMTRLQAGGPIDDEFLAATELRGLESLEGVAGPDFTRAHRRPWPWRRLRHLGVGPGPALTLWDLKRADLPALRSLQLALLPADRQTFELRLEVDPTPFAGLEALLLLGTLGPRALKVLLGLESLRTITLAVPFRIGFTRAGGDGWSVEVPPQLHLVRRRGRPFSEELLPFLPLVRGVARPTAAWGEDLALATAQLDALRVAHGLPWAPVA
jgi:uncharacterized protein (TIGR02996 family)